MRSLWTTCSRCCHGFLGARHRLILVSPGLRRQEMATHSTLVRPSGNLAYISREGWSPGVVFCCGYMSNMNGTKAVALEDYCKRTHRSYVRFDYTGCGSSDGEFHQSTLGQWKQDVLDIIDQVTTGPQVLVGSSMGGWLMLLVALERPEKIKALVGVAAAPDFTRWRNYSDQVKADIKEKGVAYYNTEYGTASISRVFMEESGCHWLLNKEKLNIGCPVRLLHGMSDDVVPYDFSLQIAQRVESDDVEVLLRKSGDHRLSTPQDINQLTTILDQILMPEREVDYSELPSLFWVGVMMKLSFHDRFNLSLCCHATNDAFNHPALWHTVEIILMGTSSKHDDDRDKEMEVPKRYFGLLRNFTHYFRDLTVTILGKPSKIEEGFGNCIIEKEIIKTYRLDKLTLNLGKTKTVENINIVDPDGTDHSTAYLFLSFLRNSPTLKTLVIKSWPLCRFMNYDLDIVHVIQENKGLNKNLEKLSFFCSASRDWVTKNANVPTLEKTKPMLNHLCALTVLSVRSSMLDSEAVEILSKSDHAKLKQLNVLIIYSRHNDKIPEVSSESWIKLLDHSPKLEVECSVMTPTPIMELACILKPEVPLVAMTFLKFSRCDGEILYSLAEKYSSTLRKLVDFTDWGESDDAIMFLAESCTSLNYLVYHRSTYYTTVPRLAKARGTAWQQFEFREYYIDTKDRDEDTDVVIGEKETGTLYLRELEKLQTNKDLRETRLQAMMNSVREDVGFRWSPV